ncbi:MAG: hypothetical protein MSA90_10465 [Faecalicatena sp.]|uniref:GH25 family lysozyme n=1 Tax=Faecalicatena sp. TaxID=2005360 RepID=UPI00258D699F|nr:GH25 family lysozyme [Faecalicatena sp.]MCI6465875.1 hypothetical protein [Faecalicatena sp.]MDY5618709.1 GH25 family lysozyme [Lachnospiraceae bacterium]
MKRKNKGIMAGLIGISMLTGSILTGMPVQAEDITEPLPIQEETVQNEETQESTGQNEVTQGDSGQNEVTQEDTAQEENVQEQTDIQENSWRYQEGELKQTPQYRSRAAEYPYAWKKVDGVYMNSVGKPIEGAVKKGIDVSEHQAKVDWEKVKADGIEFAIIRCGYGNNFESQDDKQWLTNVSECERLGIPYGVYIYSYAKTEAEAKSEAEHVLRLISGRNLAYPVYFDMEDKSTANLSSEVKGKLAKTFCDTISSAGYSVGIYANLNWWTTMLTDPVFENTSWSKWIAQYNTTCDYGEDYDIWQCTSSGKIDGIKGTVDLNFWMDMDAVDKPDGNQGGNEQVNPPAPSPTPTPTPTPPAEPSGATLVVRRGNEYHFKYTLSNGPADLIIRYGYANDEILVGDWNGDGVDTLCVRRGNQYHFKNSLSSGPADVIVTYGRTGDKVMAGDWNGDGIDTLCVRRGNEYHFKNSLKGGGADKIIKYGRTGDSVLSGDWNGDGVDTLCVRRGNTYYFKNTLSNGVADTTIPYGYTSDSILVGDWNGNGSDTLCVRRGNQYHIKNSIKSGPADKIVTYGRTNDVTYAGKWK